MVGDDRAYPSTICSVGAMQIGLVKLLPRLPEMLEALTD